MHWLTLVPAILMSIGPAPRPAADELAEIQFRVTGLRSEKGIVQCALFSKRGWLRSPKRVAKAWPRGGEATCRFKAALPGHYVASGFHDENGDDQLDRGTFGLPTEGVAISRNPSTTFGPPDFEDAQFKYLGGPLRLKAKMRY